MSELYEKDYTCSGCIHIKTRVDCNTFCNKFGFNLPKNMERLTECKNSNGKEKDLNNEE